MEVLRKGIDALNRGDLDGWAACHVWQVNWFADGQTERRHVFRERAEALEAAGLRE